MVIKKMSASFGRLQNESLSLKSGLNIIYAPNEGGKSTWCAFIRAMLFGIDTSERERAGHKPAKKKYAPWNGAPMEGSMTIELKGRDVEISRRGSALSPMQDFRAVYTDSREPVSGMNFTNSGEMLTGVTAPIFESSAFIRQSGMTVSSSAELERRIASIVSTGEEATSYSDADNRLRAWLRRKKYNKTGQIPELESGISKAEEQLRSLGSTRARLDELYAAKLATEKRCADISVQIEEHRKKTRRAALERLSGSQAEMSKRESSLKESKVVLAFVREELSNSPFGFTPPNDLEREINSDAEKAAELNEKASQKPSVLPTVLLGLIAMLSAFAAFFYSNYIFAVTALSLLAAVYTLSRFFRIKREIAAAHSGLSELRAKYGADKAADIRALLDSHRDTWLRYTEAERNLETATRELDVWAENRRNMEAELLSELDFTSGSSEAVKLSSLLKREEAELSRLNEETHVSEGRFQVLGDPMAIETELLKKKELLKELSAQYDALALSIEILKEANTEIQSRFSPRLSRKATEYMSAITGAKYSELAFDKRLSAQVAEADGSVMRDYLFLSQGTADQIYFSLRLAIAEIALPEDDRCPLILDDSLVNFDDERLSAALELLKQIAESRQIILFTCHRRERDYFAGDTAVNILSL